MKIGIDVHCHLQHPKFAESDIEEEELIASIREKIKRVIVAGYDLRSNLQALSLQEKYPDILSACIGHHPTTKENPEGFFNLFDEKKDQIVGIGEIGMDYFHIHKSEDRERQKLILMDIMERGADTSLPLVLHSRDAEKPLLSLLEETKNPIVLHSFNGAPAQVQKAISRKFWISVSTQVLYSKRVQELITEVPLSQLLLETDSPFLNRGEINVPWNILKSAKVIGESKGMSPEKILQETQKNAKKIFPFKKTP